MDPPRLTSTACRSKEYLIYRKRNKSVKHEMKSQRFTLFHNVNYFRLLFSQFRQLHFTCGDQFDTYLLLVGLSMTLMKTPKIYIWSAWAISWNVICIDILCWIYKINKKMCLEVRLHSNRRKHTFTGRWLACQRRYCCGNLIGSCWGHNCSANKV